MQRDIFWQEINDYSSCRPLIQVTIIMSNIGVAVSVKSKGYRLCLLSAGRREIASPLNRLVKR